MGDRSGAKKGSVDLTVSCAYVPRFARPCAWCLLVFARFVPRGAVRFHRPIHRVAFPPGLKRLTFGWRFNFPITEVVWPSSMKRLMFGSLFNQVRPAHRGFQGQGGLPLSALSLRSRVSRAVSPGAPFIFLVLCLWFSPAHDFVLSSPQAPRPRAHRRPRPCALLAPRFASHLSCRTSINFDTHGVTLFHPLLLQRPSPRLGPCFYFVGASCCAISLWTEWSGPGGSRSSCSDACSTSRSKGRCGGRG